MLFVTPAVEGYAYQNLLEGFGAAESLIERLAAGIAEAAEREADPERKSRLKALARELGGMAKAVVVSVASQIVGHQVVH